MINFKVFFTYYSRITAPFAVDLFHILLRGFLQEFVLRFFTKIQRNPTKKFVINASKTSIWNFSMNNFQNFFEDPTNNPSKDRLDIFQ